MLHADAKVLDSIWTAHTVDAINIMATQSHVAVLELMRVFPLQRVSWYSFRRNISPCATNAYAMACTCGYHEHSN
jgi:hypothetical protein